MEDVTAAFALEEPSVVIDLRLRTALTKRLTSSSVDVRLTSKLTSTTLENRRLTLRTSTSGSFRFDKAVNATGFQALVPIAFEEHLPLHTEVLYQVCLGLIYIDTCPSEKPISRIVMDGWFPCLMPMVTNDEQPQREYTVTHGIHTIMASCRQPHDAEALLQSLTDGEVEFKVRASTEMEMKRFWPEFSHRFEYVGWKGVVQAKLNTRSEFRSSVTFEHNGVMYVFPSKISNVLDAFDETKALLTGIGCIERNETRYPIGGVLETSVHELRESPRRAEEIPVT